MERVSDEQSPGRETDAAVHRALWPDDKVEYLPPVKSAAGWRGRPACWRYQMAGEWRALPHYTTDPSAWYGLADGRGWYWITNEGCYGVKVILLVHPINEVARRYDAVSDYADHNNSRSRARAMAQSLCVLQLAE